MAVSLTSALYPPMFSSTFAPAFVNTTSPKIYFSISPFNTASDISRVHISLVNQTTNENALTDATGILLSEGLQYDTDAGMYYVVIPVDHVKNGTNSTGWNYNQFYKLQLRFDSYDGDGVLNNSDYFISHTAHFSEWSEICLLRPILQPQVLLRTFDTTDGSVTPSFNLGVIPISGKLYFGNENNSDEIETLQSYYIEVVTRNGEDEVLTSETIYTGDNVDPNTIYYNLDLSGLNTENTVKFIMRLHITTSNNYTMTREYNFDIADYTPEDTFNPAINATLDNENGIVTVTVENENTVFGTVYIRRSSSVSNFKEWESIYETAIAGAIHLTVKDNTVGSGIWYQYSIQLQNTAGSMTPVYKTDIVFPDFYNAILSRGDKQIGIIFNYQISSYKPVVNRQKMDTLGGKYPKFAENAAMNYIQFSITGMISAQEDENKLFMDEEDYYGDMYQNYTIYNDNNGITNDYNYFWERAFRQELVKWLNDGEPKLYRSKTEGLMVVMLTDISLTPNTTLSRRLYDFSATVYEIQDGNSLKTLDSLGIYDVHYWDENQQNSGDGDGPIVPEYVEVQKPGQIYSETVSNMVSGRTDVVANTIMARIIQKYGGVQSDKNPSEGYLKNVKIWFESKPHRFIQTAGGLKLVTDISQYSAEDRKRIQLGYSFEVNNQGVSPTDTMVFFVNEMGYYQIPNSINVTSLFFPQSDDVVTVEYVIDYKEKHSSNSVISGTSIQRQLVGQEQGVFQPYQYLGEYIRRKYSFVATDEYYQQMQWWRGICLDVDPYALVNIKYHGENTYTTYEVGDTGVLHMLRDTSVQDMCFIGKRMHIVDKTRRPFLENWECVLDDSVDATTWYTVLGVDTLQPVTVTFDDADPITILGNRWNTLGDMESVTASNTRASHAVSDSISRAVAHPKYNTVYRINGQTYIYYVNGQWYPVEIDDEVENTIIAAVPIEGIVSYYGQIIRNTYS